MAEGSPTPTISMRERSYPAIGSGERLPKWFVFSLLLHLVLIAAIFLAPMLPSETRPVPVYTVDLVGGEKIGRANFGTQLTPAPKPPAKIPEADRSAPVPEVKKEVKKEKVEKEEKPKPKAAEPKPAAEEKIVLKEKAKTEPAKTETIRKEPPKEVKPEAREATKSETASAGSVRERLIQSAVDRAKTRTENAQKPSKGEVLSAGSGEGEGAAAIGAGGRGGPGIVKGMDFIIYQNRMLATIKENWAWVGQRTNLKVVVHFGIKENGEIFGLKIVQPSGDPTYDESVLRAVKKSNPLAAPPESYRSDFADVELTFRPRDLGA
ncbi:MAG: energy transducer TonB [Candidatus Binatia bacterium]